MRTPEYPPTPELDRMLAVREKSQAIGEFLEWVQVEKGYLLAQYEGEHLYSVSAQTENMLAEYFGIDRNKIEQERRAVLEWHRKQRPNP